MHKENNYQSLTFEAAIQQLEEIVLYLENGELPLEEAISAFEKGVQLARISQQTLQEAEQRVQVLLNKDNDPILSHFTPDKKLEK
ncbi:MAG: exodeoxyribonuclease VII small subunit [Candidatus Dasytiphilus stammeri]